MGQTCTFLRYHIVFGTKDRRPWIGREETSDLCGYIRGILHNINGQLITANGGRDHLHVLTDLPPTVSVSDAVKTIKANSSRWVHDNWKHADEFAWQRGYGAFTVSKTVSAQVGQYIDGQEAHHHKMTFLEELKALCDKHGIEYDAQYL